MGGEGAPYHHEHVGQISRLIALPTKVRVRFNNSTIYLDFSAIFSQIDPS